MATITASGARKSLARVMDTARREAVFVERRGAAETVAVSPAEYERLLSAAEEIENIAAFYAVEFRFNV